MKKIRRAVPNSPGITRRALAARTGAHCPTNGFWLPEGGTGKPVFLFQGSIMPMGEAGPGVWVLQADHIEPAYPLAGSRH
jgi:hypothetical protein